MNKKVISTIVGVTLAAIGVFAILSNTIYVSTVAQLTSAMQTAESGDTIYLRAGTYLAPATGWQFANGGVTLANYPNEQAILSSKNKTSGNYVIKCLLASPAVDDVKIIGSDVGNQKGIVITGEPLGIAPAIVGYQCDNWEIAGVEFRNVAYAIFQRKVNYGNTSADKWYVHDNFVNDYYRESGMQFNGNGNRIENNLIVKVTADSSTTYGCQLLNLLGNNNIVRGNQLERVNQTVRCIGIFFEWDLADNNLIENNTIIGVPNGLSFFGGDNNIIRNNVMTGTDTAFVIRSWADTATAYPCNFSSFMPLESDTANPDWQYMYPHDCRSKGNRFENNLVSGFATLSRIDLPEASNVFVSGTIAPPTSTVSQIITQTVTITPTVAPVNTRMLIPLYTSPINWGQVVDANSDGVIDVIINPADGVGTSRQADITNGIAALRNAGVGIFGYIATGYGNRDIAAIKSEVDTWELWYAPNGIFLDEVTNTAGGVSYYEDLYGYIKSKGLTVLHNPGTMTIEPYMDIADVTCVFEAAPRFPIPYPSWGAGYPEKLCALSFNASRDQMLAFIAEAKGKFRHVYVTNDTLGNPWDNLPYYLGEEAALLAGVVIVPTNTPTNIPPSITPSLTPSRTPTVTASVTLTQTPTRTPTQTPTRTPTATYTPTASPTVSITPTNTVPAPGSLTCVLVTWTRGLNLRPTESMDNTPYQNMNFGYGANFPVQRIFWDEDGNRWMQINEHIYAAMYLAANGKTYAISWPCPQG